MGFFDIVLEIIQAIGKFNKEQQEKILKEVDRAQKRYENYSDEKLLRIYPRLSGYDKAGCRKVILERGLQIPHPKPENK